MTSTTVKCANCNVVINELLTFLRNVVDFMDEESIHQLCTSTYSAEEIVKAKSLLYDAVPNAKKMPLRRKEGKKRMSRDLDDIICLMKAGNRELFPIFAAVDIHRVPPVSFDHVDATRILKDILRMQNQIAELKENAVSRDEFEGLKQVIGNMKFASILDNSFSVSKVNHKRGACLQDSFSFDSGPIGLHYMPINTSKSSADIEVKLRDQQQVNDRPSNSNDDIAAESVPLTCKQNCETSKNCRVEAAISAQINNPEREDNNNAQSTGPKETVCAPPENTESLSQKPVCEQASCARSAAAESPIPVSVCSRRAPIDEETSQPASRMRNIKDVLRYQEVSVDESQSAASREDTEWQIVHRSKSRRR
ncbi:uncharacterized protein LOC132903508 [Amyelois transitella]|uniref:uncharacterized protein LOC132903508 n=1 Tax=Amyelois transitella TaxID=680683 RepID=UPI00298FF2E6|nr:uncharacterized protein LOC132903508 [Amyelois transitella]